MKETGGKSQKLRWYGIVIGLAYLALQHCIYLLGHNISGLVGNTPFLPKIPFIDDAIPIISVFIIFYVWSYAFWAMGPMAASKCESDHFRDFLAAAILAMLVGAVVLIFAPTYMDRVEEGLYKLTDGGILDQLRVWWYSLDGGDKAYNLFPSFHCLNSTMCYLGVMRRKEISKWFRVYSFVMMILIFASTVFVKQHFILDVFAGILISVISFAVCKKWHWGRVFLPIAKGYRSLVKHKNNRM